MTADARTRFGPTARPYMGSSYHARGPVVLGGRHGVATFEIDCAIITAERR